MVFLALQFCPMQRFFYLSLLVLTQITVSQETKRVLFLGNSYTYANNLPYLTQQAATSVGDTFIYDSNTPGGYTLEGHSTNSVSQTKIRNGNWDYVVLQEQSQKPAYTDSYVDTEVYPFAQKLNDSILKYNPCGETTFYMTWGREHGDASNCATWPPMCTYEGMDDLLRLRYQTMANDNEGITAPVGAVWRYLRTNHPTLNLYSSDGSHPSLLGSYTGAITFYCALFRKDPTLVTFNSSLSPAVADLIKQAVKYVVFEDFTEWNIGDFDPIANFNYIVTGNSCAFTNLSSNESEYNWNFGDSNTSTDENPTHMYDSDGEYTVTLSVSHCGLTETFSQNIIIGNASINDELLDTKFRIIKNPITDFVLVHSKQFYNERLTIQLISLKGQLLLSESSNFSVEQKIDVTNLPAGLYLIKILNHNEVIFKEKIIIK